MTEAASLNFGPAWLRDSLGSGAGGGGGGGSEIATTNSLHYHLHAATKPGCAGGGGAGAFVGMKLAEHRYGREEMLALFSDRRPNQDQIEALMTTGLLTEAPLAPLNLMGPMPEEEQRAWQRGANSDQSLRIYSKQDKGSSGGPSERGGLCGARGGSVVGRGRGVGRGGGGGVAFFDRHDDDPGRGRGVDRDGEGRPFGRGSKSHERSASWFDRQEDGGTNGSVSPRKGYSRAPFDDWRKGNDAEDDGGWRTFGAGPSGRRWNAPSTSDRSNWRSGDHGGEPGYRSREHVNGNSASWRQEDDRSASSVKDRGGVRTATSFGRQRQRQDGSTDLPEWAMDDGTGRSSGGGGGGGSFDAAGKFRAPSSESPPPSNRSVAESREEAVNGPLGRSNNANRLHDWGIRESNLEGGRQRGMLSNDDDQEDQFVDVEVDVDDLPPDLRQKTLGERRKEERNSEPKPHRDGPEMSSAPLADGNSYPPSSLGLQRSLNELRGVGEDDALARDREVQRRSQDKPMKQQQRHMMDDDMVKSLVSGLVDDDPSGLADRRDGKAGSPLSERQRQVTADETQWYYLDPQGNIQGPFQNRDMFEWYNAGYFPAELRLRRAEDKRFVLLAEMRMLYDRVPFTPGSWQVPPPLESSDQKAVDEQKNSLMQQVQQHVLVQQQIQLQQQRVSMLEQQLVAESGNPLAALSHARPLMIRKQELELEHQAQQQSINKLMHSLSLLPHPNPSKPPSFHNSSGHGVAIHSELMNSEMGMLLKQQQQQQQHHHQEQQQGSIGLGAYGLGLSGSVLKTGLSLSAGEQQREPPQPQQMRAGFLDGMGSIAPGTADSAAKAAGRSYDPIKSLIKQLQTSDADSPAAMSEAAERQAADEEHNAFTSAAQPLQESIQPAARSIWGDVPLKEDDGFLQISQAQQELPSHMSEGHLIAGPWGHQRDEDIPKTVGGRWEDSVPSHQEERLGSAQEQLQPPSGQNLQQEDSSSLQRGASEVVETKDVEAAPGSKKSTEPFVATNARKDRKSKRAEERKKQKELNKKAQADAAQRYIPGMEGTVRPEEPVTVDKAAEDEQHKAQADALQRLQLEQQEMFEREQQEAVEKHRQTVVKSASRLAPWAKKSDAVHADSNSSSGGGGGELGDGMSLAEIQRMEEEREREAQLRREMEEELLREQRAKREQEAKRQQKGHGLNWATAAATSGAQQSKSLAEIQAEEAAREQESQERERQQKRARQKDMGLMQASVWGSASANLSWACKASPNVSAAQSTVNASQSPKAAKNNKQQQQQQQQSNAWGATNQSKAAGGGFWDEAPPLESQSNPAKSKKKGGGASKKAKEESKVAAIFKENKKPANVFEQWCGTALHDLHAQIDIPTFMAFLNDIDSPYEVNDYVKSYIGEGKAPKAFAKEYIERRSKWKNSMKSRPNLEDDLLTPAQAINPNNTSDDAVPSGGGGNAGGKSKKKPRGAGGRKLDASHLLGFSVSSDRVNAGDIDHPL